MHNEDYTCGGCGVPLTDAGPVGYYCPNKECNYEWKMAARMAAEMRERDERAEYERLKAKYEPAPIAGE